MHFQLINLIIDRCCIFDRIWHLFPAEVVGRRDGRRPGEPAQVGIAAAVTVAVAAAPESRSSMVQLTGQDV